MTDGQDDIVDRWTQFIEIIILAGFDIIENLFVSKG